MNSQRMDEYKPSCPKHIFIHETEGKGLGLFAKKAIKRRRHIFDFAGTLRPLSQATPMSLQLSEDMFLVSDGRFDDLINHSCDPNGIVQYNGANIALFAARDIDPGEELTFNYNTTEWDLIEQTKVFGSPCSISCHCETSNCHGQVIGFRYLPLEEKIRISPMISPFLRFRMMEEVWQQTVMQQSPLVGLPSSLVS